MTPEPDTPPSSTPDSYPLGDLIHAALQSKEYLGRASADMGTLTHVGLYGLVWVDDLI